MPCWRALGLQPSNNNPASPPTCLHVYLCPILRATGMELGCWEKEGAESRGEGALGVPQKECTSVPTQVKKPKVRISASLSYTASRYQTHIAGRHLREPPFRRSRAIPPNALSLHNMQARPFCPPCPTPRTMLAHAMQMQRGVFGHQIVQIHEKRKKKGNSPRTSSSPSHRAFRVRG